MQQAKVVILGEPRTGKSSLINSLTAGGTHDHAFSDPTQDDTREAFITVQIPDHELEYNDGGDTVCLRFWECVEQKGQDVAFPGALFCIIVFDIRAPETANAAFNKWLAIKETHMTESFLFVVGTFLDMNVHRRVEINDVCKACVQKDAVYVEVSNTTGSNMSLLRNLLIQRVNYMLKVRQDLKNGIQFDTAAAGADSGAGKEKRTVSNKKAKQLNTPFLEEDIDADSIGSILASSIGIEYWPGYEAERENLTKIGKSLTNLVNSLEACDVSGTDVDAVTMDKIVELMKKHGDECDMLSSEAPLPTEPDFEELRHAYEIMGLTLPQALLGEEQLLASHAGRGTTQNCMQASGGVAPVTSSVKIRVKLPDGSHAALKLTGDADIGTQVAQFLDENGMHTDTHAFEKLVDAGAKALEGHAKKLANGGTTEPTPKKFTPMASPVGSDQLSGGRWNDEDESDFDDRCIVRVKLPNGQVIETTVGQAEDAQVVAARIAAEHGLSMGYQNKVWEQLRSAQLQQNMGSPISDSIR